MLTKEFCARLDDQRENCTNKEKQRAGGSSD